MKYNTINLENSHSQKILSLGSLDYLNAKYQGYLKDFSCESIGALLWDNGYFYIGQWKKNKIHGKGLFIFPNGSYIYSTFFEDKLHGLAIMKFASGCMMVGNWDFNKKNGLFLYFDKEKNSWFLCQHTIKQKNPEIINEEIVKGENFPVFLEYYPALQKLLKENVFSLLEDDLKDNHLAYTKWQDNLE